jgi:hypothetical protein
MRPNGPAQTVMGPAPYAWRQQVVPPGAPAYNRSSFCIRPCSEVYPSMATMPELTEKVSTYEARTTALRDSL